MVINQSERYQRAQNPLLLRGQKLRLLETINCSSNSLLIRESSLWIQLQFSEPFL